METAKIKVIDITWEDGKPSFGPLINYPNGAPPFK